MKDVSAIVAALRECLPDTSRMIALHEPVFGGNEWEYVKECLDTGWVSSVGKYVDLFEARLAEYTGVRRAVAVVNGTAALHVALRLAGVEKEDEVLVPALTFIATTNAVSYTSAIPHFVDCEERTLGLDPAKLDAYLSKIASIKAGTLVNKATGRRIKAVVPMHTFGHPVDLDVLVEVCERHRIVMVEDAAESLGSYYKGRHTGNWGKLATLSFNGNKTITTGGGGAILTNDERLADYAKHLTTTAKVPHRWQYVHDEIGYNYRMPNLNAALGVAQLEQLPIFLEHKRRLADRYARTISSVEGVRFIREPSFARSNYWLNAILLDEDWSEYRDALLDQTNESFIMTRPTWALMHTMQMYASCPRMDLSVAENLALRLINIPSSAHLEASHVAT